MAREFDGPLTKKDIAWLESRYPVPYVERMVELHGVAKGKASKSSEKDENGPETPEGTVEGTDANENPGGAENGSDEDLIGDEAFDVVGSTEAEVKEWAANASDEDKAAALAAEQAREDRDPRKGVLAILA